MRNLTQKAEFNKLVLKESETKLFNKNISQCKCILPY